LGTLVQKKEEIDQFEAKFGPAILFLGMGGSGGGGGEGNLKEIFLRILIFKTVLGTPVWQKKKLANWEQTLD